MLENASISFERMLKYQLDVEKTRYSVCSENMKKICKSFSSDETSAIFAQMEQEHIDVLKKMSIEEQAKLRSKMNEVSEALSNPIRIEVNRWISLEKCHRVYRSKLLNLESEVELHCDKFTSYINEDLNAFEDMIKAKACENQ